VAEAEDLDIRRFRKLGGARVAGAVEDARVIRIDRKDPAGKPDTSSEAMIRRPGVGLSEAPITAIDSGRNSGSSRIAPRFVEQIPVQPNGFADAAEAPARSRSGPARGRATHRGLI